jgi:putative transposase
MASEGVRVSPRTVRRYMARGSAPRGGARSQMWSTFVRNHARAVLACDFFVAVTATFRVLYVFVLLEVGSRRILHWNVTDHPTAEWTRQQFRTLISGEQPHRWVIHDRDCIFSEGVDATVAAMGLTILRTPTRTPQANAFCERLIGTIRRECLDHPDCAERTSVAKHSSCVGRTLQSRTSARESRTGRSGSSTRSIRTAAERPSHSRRVLRPR